MRLTKVATTLVAGAVVLGLAACSGGGEVTPTITPTPVTPSGDGILRIGDMTPVSGDLSAFAASQSAGIELAAREINEQGGYNGAPVEVLHRNAGDGDPVAVEAAFNDLVARGVDVIITPASAMVSAQVLELVVKNDANVAILAMPTTQSADSDTAAEPAAVDDAFIARLKSSDPGVTEFGYGVESYDLAIAAALAASFTQDDGGASIVQGMVGITMTSGVKCDSFGMCVDVLKTQPYVDYVGPAGQITYDTATGVAYFTKK